MIEIRNVIKEFDGFRALDGLNMTVPDGAVYGLVGPNGAGKSTIIRHLTGIYRQDSGDVLVDGEQVFENPAVKNRIAYIPDDIFYFSNARIGEMASFYRSIYPQFDSGRFKKLGEVFDLDPKRQMRKLSKGMQKQASFWMMMSLRPDILVLDEPVDGLEDVCDHVGIMNRGKIMIERTLSDLQEGIVKMQLALPDGETLPDGLDILHASSTGRLQTLILHGTSAELEERFAQHNPLFMDFVPLTLEEIFIYELGGADYEVKDIVL